jgi:poly-beta-1,6-N-acetyl-D-glucosamine synthase
VGVAVASSDLVVIGDVRQNWDENTLPRLLERFDDPPIGAVSGDLPLSTENGSLEAIDFYWRLEKMLWNNESRWHSSIGVSGAVCAVRRSLFRPLLRGAIVDGVWWRMAVVLQGWRSSTNHGYRS